LSDRIVALARDEFPDSELGTALWLLRECADDEERMSALLEADGDLTTLVLAVEDRVRNLSAGR
jgi:hypothetical protein